MSSCPGLPHDPLLEEWNRAKTWQEWRRFYSKQMSLRQQLERFCAELIYFAAADLCYLDAGLLEKPPAPVLFCLEYIAEQLERDAEALATLWLVRGELVDRAARWSAEYRTMIALDRIGSEAIPWIR